MEVRKVVPGAGGEVARRVMRPSGAAELRGGKMGEK